MVSRERILEAAARVYAKNGFRGSTTRLIAVEAGVNEVTLFRTFGSKSALLEAVLRHTTSSAEIPTLPADPVDPQSEISGYVQAHLERIGEMRHMLIHTMGELDERPEAAEFACQGRRQVHDTITGYVRKLQELGLADPCADVDAAAVMLTGTVMSDAIARPIVPEVYPPLAEAAQRYTRLFLRSVALPTPAPVSAPQSPLTSSTTPAHERR
jgi:AcrR family transcriptional regulator